MAQVPEKDAPKVTLGFRIEQSLKADLDEAHRVEMRGPPERPMLKPARTYETVMGLGVDAYFAVEHLGVDRYRAVADALGTSREAMNELLQRGLESWERDHGKRTKT
ncbi:MULTISPECIES: hypothetical protein [Myxococcus]|uniref:hypothetical protein n=1 Tax=Myxococcus TaxID=32 RepID=UPI0011431C50|nr:MULTISPECIES: hypothetical protein [Myxococcus]NOK05970.1 hypothetical protein [Myxococcus xanthus]